MIPPLTKKQVVLIRINKALHRKIKMQAVKEDMTQEKWLEKYLEQVLSAIANSEPIEQQGIW